MTTFTPGQIVRVNNPKSMAYGRIARVMDHMGPEGAKVEFVDLSGNTGAEMYSMDEYLTPIAGVPNAARYLFITIVEHNGSFCYHGHCLAHVQDGRDNVAVMKEIARNWYEGGGQWSDKEQAYVFVEFDRQITVDYESYEEVTLAEYISLRHWFKELTPGYWDR